jgi:hypothetical protein
MVMQSVPILPAKDVGDSKAWQGELDGVKFHLFCMKEPDYVMRSLMSTYGMTSPKSGQGEIRWHYKNAHGSNEVMKSFRCPKVVANHYAYCGCVDNHNNKQQDGGSKQGLALESTWVTHWWPIQVFTFSLDISEVNTYLSWVYLLQRQKA